MIDPSLAVGLVLLAVLLALALGYLVGKDAGYTRGWAEARPRRDVPFKGPEEWFAGGPDPEPDAYVDPEDEYDRRQDYRKRGEKAPDWDGRYE